jgi:hypothetical protein
MCYIHVCKAVEAFSRFQAAAWLKEALNLEKLADAERAKEDEDNA